MSQSTTAQPQMQSALKQNERWDDPQAGLDAALLGLRKDIWTALPGIVVSRTGNYVTVNPAIQGIQQSRSGQLTNVNLPQLIYCPLVLPGGGGFAVTLPIGEGDEVLVVFSARCIDGWWNSGQISPQIEIRMHDLSDGFAIPALMSQPKLLSNISANSVQIRSVDGDVYIEITSGHVVNIVAPGGVNITGNVTVTGTISATGEITADSGASSIGVATHKHSNVQTGGGESGPPVPGT